MSGWTVSLLVLSSLSYQVLSFRFTNGHNPHCPKGELMCEYLSDLFYNCSSTKTCDTEMKLQTSVQYCVDKKHICDGQKHCPDGSDEKYCPYVFEYTPEMAYRANFHRFVSGDCGDDYVECETGKAKRPSSSRSNKCFYKEFICSSIGNNCEDGSDKKYCPYDLGFPLERISYVESYPAVGCYYGNDDFSCEDPVWPGQCVKKSFVCDGMEDCRNGLDERYCPHDLNFSHSVPTRLAPPPQEVIRTTTEQVAEETPEQVTQEIPIQTTQETPTEYDSLTTASSWLQHRMGTQMESLIRENTLAMEKVVDAVKQLELAFQRSGVHSPPATSDPARR